MKFNVQDVSAVKKRIEVIVPADDVTNRIEKKYNEVAGKAKIKGFRPGKAPRKVVEKHYADLVFGQVSMELIEEYSKRALEEAKVSPVGGMSVEPNILESGKDFTFFVEVDVLPEFALQEYKGLTVEIEDVDVTDKEVDEAIEELRKRNTQLKTPDPARPAEKDDVVTMEMKAESKGIPIAHEEDFSVGIGWKMMPEGFEEALIGMKIGDRKAFEVTYPEEEKSPLSGQTVKFDIKVKDIKEKVVPELDDEFAKDVGRENVSDLREYLKSRIKEVKEETRNLKIKDEILRQLREKHPIELPASLVEEKQKVLREELKRELERRNYPYLRTFEDGLKSRAEQAVHDEIILQKIAEAEKIEVTDEEVEKELRELAERMERDYEKLRDMIGEKGFEALKARTKREKTLDFLVSNAKIISSVKVKTESAETPQESEEKV